MYVGRIYRNFYNDDIFLCVGSPQRRILIGKHKEDFLPCLNPKTSQIEEVPLSSLLEIESQT